MIRQLYHIRQAAQKRRRRICIGRSKNLRSLAMTFLPGVLVQVSAFAF
jgi:hypothetical protein